MYCVYMCVCKPMNVSVNEGKLFCLFSPYKTQSQTVNKQAPAVFWSPLCSVVPGAFGHTCRMWVLVLVLVQ